tara:strand:+ start:449 stop:916 length:468 start_codon:yes stop_codon:yes gene_type:complete
MLSGSVTAQVNCTTSYVGGIANTRCGPNAAAAYSQQRYQYQQNLQNQMYDLAERIRRKKLDKEEQERYEFNAELRAMEAQQIEQLRNLQIEEQRLKNEALRQQLGSGAISGDPSPGQLHGYDEQMRALQMEEARIRIERAKLEAAKERASMGQGR